jgi:hypothetical protein
MESFIDHEDARKHIPAAVLTHLEGLIAHSRLPDTEEMRRKLIEAWLLKKASFQKMIDHDGFQEAEFVRKDDPSGCCVLTLSGSLVMVGPLTDGKREMSYSSIGLRTDVPEAYTVSAGLLAEDIACGKPLRLRGGKFEKTSAVTDIAVRPGDEHRDVQTVSLRRADQRLKSDFVRVNRQTLEAEESGGALRSRDDLFNRWIIIQWFLYGGLEKHVFMARAKMLWLELFTGVYDALSVKYGDAAERDDRFLDFTNNRFAKFCDDYKWYESERKNFDIGLMKALEELPEYTHYIDYVSTFRTELAQL